MTNIIRASLFKLFKDWTFRITMIVGIALAALMVGINALANSLTGEGMLLTSVSPSNNFGLTVPINLIIFTVSEFTFGTIRNKIIAGHSKLKVYVGLSLTGLIFTFILMSVYLALCVGIGSIAGGFHASAIGGARFICSFLAYTVVTYIFVTALSIFFASIFRNIGATIPVVVVLLVFLSLIPLIIVGIIGKGFTAENVTMWLDPTYMLGLYGSASNIIAIVKGLGGNVNSFFMQSNQMIAAGILTPIYWSVILFISGAYIFTHRDIK